MCVCFFFCVLGKRAPAGVPSAAHRATINANGVLFEQTKLGISIGDERVFAKKTGDEFWIMHRLSHF